ncbi:hypothetical protein HK099_004611 [Clydaea vesicula]|uniref:Magnesium transporter n=1 Tax=Clydaea vesicula TaxID=447962 RepID=A0AAD5XVI0_9FUNG|nr:hypothetical protein HK099_004611 [Clydaea vesicula]
MVGGQPNVAEVPAWHKIAGISLAVTSSLFIGSSFVIKKKGLINSNEPGKVNDDHSYLKEPLWWTGMILMLVGEIFNLMAYAFSPAILVTPLGALSVVISAALSSYFLNEKLTFSGKVGCVQCVIGSIIIVFYAPVEGGTQRIPEFFALTRHVPFGSAIVYSISNPQDSQFKYWELYFLMGFVIFSGVLQINYLNKALNLFNTAVVTPIYYVMFTTATYLCSGILAAGFKFNLGSTLNFFTLLIGFLVIVGGVSLLFGDTKRYAKQLAAAEIELEKRGIEDGNEGLLRNNTRESEDHNLNSPKIPLNNEKLSTPTH